MASTRLTKTLRDDIHAALMSRAFIDEKRAIEDEEHSLALAVYNDLYPENIQQIMAALPSEFFCETRSLRVSFNGDYCHLKMQDKRPLGEHMRSAYRALKSYTVHEPLTKRFAAWHKKKEQADDASTKLSAETRKMLDACSTVKQLIATWPEIEPLLDTLGIKADQHERPSLPAVRKDMNAIFKLPPETQQ